MQMTMIAWRYICQPSFDLRCVAGLARFRLRLWRAGEANSGSEVEGADRTTN